MDGWSGADRKPDDAGEAFAVDNRRQRILLRFNHHLPAADVAQPVSADHTACDECGKVRNDFRRGISPA